MSLSKAALMLAVAGLAPAVASAKGAPKPLEPEHALKPAEGYFDEAFALEPGGARLWLVRTDGATFAKLEVVDLHRQRRADVVAHELEAVVVEEVIDVGARAREEVVEADDLVTVRDETFAQV